MENSIGIISDVLMSHLIGDTNLDMCDMMRVNLFTMDVERVARALDVELPKEMFLDKFCEGITKTSGYTQFNAFCEIDMEGLRDIGERAYSLLT